MNISTFVFPESSPINTVWWVWTFLLIGWGLWVAGTIALNAWAVPAFEDYKLEDSKMNFWDKYRKYIITAISLSVVSMGIVMIIFGAYSTEFGTTYAEFTGDANDFDSIYYTIEWQLGFLIPGAIILFLSSLLTVKMVSAWRERFHYKKLGAPYSFWSFKGFWLQTRHIIYAILTLVAVLMGWGFIVNGTGHIFGGIFVRSPV